IENLINKSLNLNCPSKATQFSKSIHKTNKDNPTKIKPNQLSHKSSEKAAHWKNIDNYHELFSSENDEFGEFQSVHNSKDNKDNDFGEFESYAINDTLNKIYLPFASQINGLDKKIMLIDNKIMSTITSPQVKSYPLSGKNLYINSNTHLIHKTHDILTDRVLPKLPKNDILINDSYINILQPNTCKFNNEFEPNLKQINHTNKKDEKGQNSILSEENENKTNFYSNEDHSSSTSDIISILSLDLYSLPTSNSFNSKMNQNVILSQNIKSSSILTPPMPICTPDNDIDENDFLPFDSYQSHNKAYINNLDNLSKFHNYNIPPPSKCLNETLKSVDNICEKVAQPNYSPSIPICTPNTDIDGNDFLPFDSYQSHSKAYINNSDNFSLKFNNYETPLSTKCLNETLKSVDNICEKVAQPNYLALRNEVPYPSFTEWHIVLDRCKSYLRSFLHELQTLKKDCLKMILDSPQIHKYAANIQYSSIQDLNADIDQMALSLLKLYQDNGIQTFEFSCPAALNSLKFATIENRFCHICFLQFREGEIDSVASIVFDAWAGVSDPGDTDIFYHRSCINIWRAVENGGDFSDFGKK
ncbi:unnamed protein product, partial [Gordionus sp. m RMFG-2023]